MGSKERRREIARKRRELKEQAYREFFHERSPRYLHEYYRDKVPEHSPYSKVSDEAVVRMLETVLKYEEYVKFREREFKKVLEEKNKKIQELEEKIRKLEAKQGPRGSGGQYLQKMDKVDERSQKDFNAMKVKAHAAFRGDDFAEKAGEKASNIKDQYESLLQAIADKKRIYLNPNRAKALADSAKFRLAFQSKFEGVDEDEKAELWNYHFGDGRTKETLSQYGLSSDRDENWDFDWGQFLKGYNPTNREYHEKARSLYEKDKQLNKANRKRKK